MFFLLLSPPFPLSSSPKWSKSTFQMLQIMKTAFSSWADPETESDWTSSQEKSEEKTRWATPPQARRWSASHGWPRHFIHLTLSYGHCFCDETPWSKATRGRCQCSELCGQLKKEKHSKRYLGFATTVEEPASEGLNSKQSCKFVLLHKSLF